LLLMTFGTAVVFYYC
jgi:hypothetical protein